MQRTGLHADVAVGARAAVFCHLGNINWAHVEGGWIDGCFIGDEQANALITQNYREYIVPETVEFTIERKGPIYE